MNINDIRFQNIVEKIKESIQNGNPFKFEIDRETYQKIGISFFDLINRESFYNYIINVTPDFGRNYYKFSCKFKKMK